MRHLLRLAVWSSRRPAWILVLFWAALVAVKILLAAQLPMPVVWGDSVLYLSRARNLALLGWPIIENICGPVYPPLYSIVIAPVYLFTIQPATAHQGVLAINALISSSILFPAYLIHKEITGKVLPSLAVAAVVGALPVTFAYSLTVMAENLSLPVLLWFFWAVLRYPQLRLGNALFVGLAAGAAIVTKSLNVGLLPGAAALGLWALIDHRRTSGEGRRAWLCLGAMALGAFLPLYGWTWWNGQTELHSTLPSNWTGTYPFHLYREVLISTLTDFGAAFHFVRLFAKQLAYLFFGTFGLAGITGVGLCARIWRGPARAPWLAILSSWAGLLFLGAMHCAAYFPMDPERYTLFGRYADSMTPLLIILGFAFLERARSRRKILVGASAPFALMAALALPWPGLIWLHRIDLFYLRPSLGLVPYRPMILLLTLIFLTLFFAFRRYQVRIATLLIVGTLALGSSALAASAIRSVSRGLLARHAIARTLENRFVVGKDLLVVSLVDFQQQLCFHNRHWIPLYQIGSLPFLFADTENLRSLGTNREVFFLTTWDVSGMRPIASEAGERLYRTTAGALAQALSSTPGAGER